VWPPSWQECCACYAFPEYSELPRASRDSLHSFKPLLYLFLVSPMYLVWYCWFCLCSPYWECSSLEESLVVLLLMSTKISGLSRMDSCSYSPYPREKIGTVLCMIALTQPTASRDNHLVQVNMLPCSTSLSSWSWVMSCLTCLSWLSFSSLIHTTCQMTIHCRSSRII